MKALYLLLFISALTGCAGTMFDGRVCTFATQDQTRTLTAHVINSYVDERDKFRAQQYLGSAKLGVTALCEMARARDASIDSTSGLK